MLLLLGRVVHADPDDLRVERGELAGTPTEVGRLHRSPRGVRLREEEDYQVLLAPELAEIERAALVRGPGERGKRVANSHSHGLPDLPRSLGRANHMGAAAQQSIRASPR